MALDRSRPYAEVWGMSGVSAYEQDGQLFNLAGDPVDDKGAPVPADPPAAPAKKTATSAKTASSAPDFSAKSDDELRALVEIASGTWTDRDAAIALLSGG